MSNVFRSAWVVFICALASVSCRKTDTLAGLTGEELRAAGLEKMESGDFPAARESFETLVARSGPMAGEGTYWVGMTYFRQDLYDDAYARFEQLIDRYPASEWCDDAQYMKGECRLKSALPLEKDQTKVDEAFDEFNTLLEEYENSDLIPQAKQGIKECLRLKAAKLLAVGKFYKKTGKYHAAAIYFDNLGVDYPEYENLAEAAFLAGECYAQTGEKETAAARYRDVVSRFPQSPFAAHAAAKLAALEK